MTKETGVVPWEEYIANGLGLVKERSNNYPNVPRLVDRITGNDGLSDATKETAIANIKRAQILTERLLRSGGVLTGQGAIITDELYLVTPNSMQSQLDTHGIITLRATHVIQRPYPFGISGKTYIIFVQPKIDEKIAYTTTKEGSPSFRIEGAAGRRLHDLEYGLANLTKKLVDQAQLPNSVFSPTQLVDAIIKTVSDRVGLGESDYSYRIENPRPDRSGLQRTLLEMKKRKLLDSLSSFSAQLPSEPTELS